nr:EamA family transporter [uncultured Oscillibacter sp.]
MNETKRRSLRGMVCTTVGGVCWGVSGTCGQYLFSRYGVGPLWLTCVRLLAGGALLTLLALPRHGTAILGIFKSRRDALQLVCYGVFGLLLCQYAYMTAISWSNAATTTVLQNLGLVLIMLYTCLRGRRPPSWREALALALALAGIYLLATGGNPAHMVLSPQGLFWGLAAAVAVALYSLLPRQLLSRWEQSAITGPGMLIGGAAVNLAARSWNFSVSLPVQGWLAVAAVVLLGTALAFSLIMQGVADIGPVKSSMLAATEPVSATVLSALWLGTSFSPADLIGFAAILATIFLLAKAE